MSPTYSSRSRWCRHVAAFCLCNVLAVSGLWGMEPQSPTAAQREAVKTLSELGATITIGGDFQVKTISFISQRSVTDADLASLKAFPDLERVTIMSSEVTDAGLEHFKHLSKLQSLTLRTTKTTTEGLDNLRKVLPNCRISTLSTRSGFTASTTTGWPDRSDRGGTSSFFIGGGLGDWLWSEISSVPVQVELKLSADQVRQVRQIETDRAEAIRREVNPAIGSRETSTADRVGRSEAYRNAYTKVARDVQAKLTAMLSDEQSARLKQLALQTQGVRGAIGEGVVADELQLTDEQRTRVKSLKDAETQKLRDTFAASSRTREPASASRTEQYRTEYSKIRDQTTKEIEAVLTAEQRDKWSRMIGSPRVVSAGSNGLKGTTADDFAKAIFIFLDRDGDGKLTAAEWERSRNVRSSFDRAGINLTQTMELDQFVAHYKNAYSQLGADRARQQDR